MRQNDAGREKWERANVRMTDAVVRAAERMELLGRSKPVASSASNQATAGASSVGRSPDIENSAPVETPATDMEEEATDDATTVVAHPMTPTAATTVDRPEVQLLRNARKRKAARTESPATSTLDESVGDSAPGTDEAAVSGDAKPTEDASAAPLSRNSVQTMVQDWPPSSSVAGTKRTTDDPHGQAQGLEMSSRTEFYEMDDNMDAVAAVSRRRDEEQTISAPPPVPHQTQRP